MTRTRVILAALVAAGCAGTAGAQSFSGAELRLDATIADNGNSLGHTGFGGGIEAEVFRGLGVAADLSYRGFSAFDADARNGTLHLFYRLPGIATIGVFAGQETQDGAGSSTTTGIEAQGSIGPALVEAYVLNAEGDLAAGSALGLSGSMDVTPAIAAFASFDSASFATDSDRIAIGASYRFERGARLSAEIGRLTDDGSAGTFLSITASVAVGPQGGLTFGDRSLGRLRPGGF
jgi:hypothetical protein